MNVKEIEKYLKDLKKEAGILENEIASKKKTKATLQGEINVLVDQKLNIKKYLEKKEKDLLGSVRKKEVETENNLQASKTELEESKKKNAEAGEALENAKDKESTIVAREAKADSAIAEKDRVVDIVKEGAKQIGETFSKI